MLTTAMMLSSFTEAWARGCCSSMCPTLLLRRLRLKNWRNLIMLHLLVSIRELLLSGGFCVLQMASGLLLIKLPCTALPVTDLL